MRETVQGKGGMVDVREKYRGEREKTEREREREREGVCDSKS